MNSAKKMVLIPETELKARSHIENVLNKETEFERKVQKKKESKDILDELQLLLTSEIPSTLKMRLFNSLLERYLAKKPKLISKTSPRITETKQENIEPFKTESQPQNEFSYEDNLMEKSITPESPQPSSTKTPQPRRSNRKRVPNKKYITSQSGSGRKIIPIKWVTLKRF